MKYIDLGLPSGNLWAEENEEGYFAFDDATEKFGDSLPTIDEWKELQENCAWKWDDERKGMIVKGFNGNSIFLPASGYRYDTSLFDAGSDGYYWSSSLREDRSDYARSVYFYSVGVYRDLYGRCDGFSVRTIKKQHR